MNIHAPCPPYLTLDTAARRARLDPHEPAFVQNPYEAYAFLHRHAPRVLLGGLRHLVLCRV